MTLSLFRLLPCLVVSFAACGARTPLDLAEYDASVNTSAAPASGCSDGTREGFVDAAAYPRIAACSGGFSVPGVDTAHGPTCMRRSGNTSQNPNGAGCSADDLCAVGFHVCQGAVEVALDSSTDCTGATLDEDAFFATRQGSNGCVVCTLGTLTDPSLCNGETCVDGCAQNPETTNDVFGCGNIGADTGSSCGVLNRFSHDLCSALPNTPWNCGEDDYHEARWVTKSGPEAGGVLCCAD